MSTAGDLNILLKVLVAGFCVLSFVLIVINICDIFITIKRRVRFIPNNLMQHFPKYHQDLCKLMTYHLQMYHTIVWIRSY